MYIVESIPTWVDILAVDRDHRLSIGWPCLTPQTEVDVFLGPRQNQSIERSCTRGDEDVFHLGAFRVPVGAAPRRCGLHPLPRASPWQLIAGLGGGARRRTAVTSGSTASATRILARNRPRSGVGRQASSAHSSRRADDPRTGGSGRRAVGSDSRAKSW